MIGCLVLAFQLCQVGAYGGGGYGYVQQPQVYYAQPQVVYAQPVVVAQPVYYPQPVYYGGGGGYGYQNPFGGISVAVGRHGGVRVGVNR